MGKEALEAGKKQIFPLSTLLTVIFVLWWSSQQTLTTQGEQVSVLTSELGESVRVLKSMVEDLKQAEENGHTRDVKLSVLDLKVRYLESQVNKWLQN